MPANHLLRGLPEDELTQLQDVLQPVRIVSGQVLHEAGGPIDDVYFLEGGLASLIADTGDGGSVEVGMTGREGLVGTAALLNPQPMASHRAVVQVSGTALRMRVPAFREAIGQLPGLRDHCLRFLQGFMVQTAQTAGCNARHELPERLARWLLMYRDRVDSDELPMTQEFLSCMLGVRRAGVSVVAGTLQASRVISQARGRLTIIDRAGLENLSCSCYRTIEASRRQIMQEKGQGSALGPLKGDP